MKLESIENEVKKLPLVDTVDSLHSFLRSLHCDFNRVDKLWYYVVEFIDIATDSVLFCSCYDTPILALRELPAILEKTKSNVENIVIELRFALPKSPEVSSDCCTFHDVYLSPFIYFRRPETPAETPADTSAETSADVKDNK